MTWVTSTYIFFYKNMRKLGKLMLADSGQQATFQTDRETILSGKIDKGNVDKLVVRALQKSALFLQEK